MAESNASKFSSKITSDGTIGQGGLAAGVGDTDWQAVKTTSFTAESGKGYFVDTTSGAITVTLPSSPSAGDTISFKDYAGTFGTNSLTIARNGKNIQGVANDSEISTNRASIVLVYIDATKGWLYAVESNVADLELNTFISATGGTITTSGDFKIHSFTGDGCFVVSTIGVGSSGGPANVDYLVIAGGGGGGSCKGAGGGAGGYRTTFPSPGCNAGSFPITATTYPITVGGGGSRPALCTGSASLANGSNSVFSTITSTGGGGAGRDISNGPQIGATGGSGGGGARGGSGGSGNTPPVSPSQGNNGGNGVNTFPKYGAGGGGGAGAVGVNGTSNPGGGNGGNGLANSITGSSVTRAGGGGGGAFSPCGGNIGTAGTGGSGGGGNAGANTVGQAGSINTGSGGGGVVPTGGSGAFLGGAGGSGVVIIRYKFQ